MLCEGVLLTNFEMKANIAILHVGRLERWRSNLRRKLLSLLYSFLLTWREVEAREGVEEDRARKQQTLKHVMTCA